MTSRTLALFTLLITLACGAPAYIAPTDMSTPIYKHQPYKGVIVLQTYTVLVPLTVRSAPCESSDAVDYLKAGAVVEVVGNPVTCAEDGGLWTKLKDPEGWVNMRYIK